MKKIFCSKCKYYKFIDKCYSRKNMKKSWDYFRSVIEYDEHPSIINEHNDCKWFKHSLLRSIINFFTLTY